MSPEIVPTSCGFPVSAIIVGKWLAIPLLARKLQNQCPCLEYPSKDYFADDEIVPPPAPLHHREEGFSIVNRTPEPSITNYTTYNNQKGEDLHESTHSSADGIRPYIVISSNIPSEWNIHHQRHADSY